MFFLLNLLLLCGCHSSSPAPAKQSALAWQTANGAVLLACQDKRGEWIAGQACESALPRSFPALLIKPDGSIATAQLAPTDAAPSKLTLYKYTLLPANTPGGSWLQHMRRLDYNDMNIRNQAAKLIGKQGGDDCAACIGMYGSGYADLDHDQQDEIVFVVEVDDWSGVFVVFSGEKAIKVAGHATALPTALDEAKPGKNPASSFHHTFELLSIVDLDGDRKYELVIKENKYQGYVIGLYQIGPEGSRRIADLSLPESSLD